MTDYTPPTEVIRLAAIFPRERLGEPRTIKPEAFDRWLEQVKQEARAEALADEGLLARPLPSRDEVTRLLEDLFWPMLAHDPHNPERFWGQATDAVLELLKGQEA